jgi:hypothetical protein
VDAAIGNHSSNTYTVSHHNRMLRVPKATPRQTRADCAGRGVASVSVYYFPAILLCLYNKTLYYFAHFLSAIFNPKAFREALPRFNWQTKGNRMSNFIISVHGHFELCAISLK